MWTSPWRVYTDEKRTKILNRTDDDAVLLCGEWDRIPVEDAERLGLRDEHGKAHSPRSIKAKETKAAAATVTAKEKDDGK